MQKGVTCPRGTILHDDCRACALDPLHPCALTPDLLELMRYNPDADEGVQFSPTRILGCVRRSVLEDELDWFLDIEDQWALTRGSMAHAMMEEARYPGALAIIREARLRTTLDTRYGAAAFGGKPDLIVVKGLTGNVLSVKVVDYKTKTEVKHDLTAALPSHVHQVNMYAWLVTRELPKLLGWDAVVEVDELEIVYVGFNKPRRFTSAGPLTTRGKLLSRHPRTYADLQLAPIPLYSLEATERAILRRVETRQAAKLEHGATGALPDVLPEAEQWMCDYCPIASQCWLLKEREQEGVA